MDRAKAIADLAPMAAGPLAGTLVLELCGDEPSGTLGTQILGDLGATVIKIERFGASGPDEEDDRLSMDKAYFWGLNRNKLSLACNLKAPEGREIFERLAAMADVVYDNHRVGVTKRLGADPKSLFALNPNLVICSVTGFGHAGTRSKDPAYDVTIQALGGGMSLTGTGVPGEPPVRYGNPIGGIAGGLYAVIGILAALRQRRKTGQGDRLDLALMDVQLEMHGYRVPAGASGSVAFGPEPHRGGSGALPYGPFRTKDGGWFVLGITGQFWKPFCALVGREDWVTARQYATEADRQANEAQLNADVSAVMAQKTGDAWQQAFIEAAIPGAKVCSIKDAFTHPHVPLRNMLVGFPDHELGSQLKVAGNPIKLSNHRAAALQPAPGLGEHTVEILAGLLGMDEEEISRLNGEGAVWFPHIGRSYARHSVV